MMKYQEYAEYKDSGEAWLGEVPKTWTITKLKYIKSQELNAFVDGPFGSNLKSEHFITNGDVYVIESNFATTGVLNTYELKTITAKHFETISRSEARGSDIIIAKIGARYGSAAILPILSKKAVVSGNSLKLTVNSELCNVKYALHLLNHLKNEGAMDDGVNGSAQPALSLGGLNCLPFLLPSCLEQSVIINFLDHETAKIDSLIEKQQQLIQLLKEKRQAVISHAVTKGLNPNVAMKDSGVEWLGEVPEHWEVTRFSYEIFFQEGPGILAVDFHETGIPLLRIQNVKSHFVSNNYKTYLSPSKVLSKWDHYRVEKGDLIISCSASTGLVSEVDESTVGAIPYTGLIRLKPRTRKIISQYIKLLVQSDLFFEQIEVLQTGSTIQHFGPFHLQQMYISLPAINEQQIICYEVKNRLDSIDVLISKAESAIELIQERRTALISAAVTGKIDVRNWQNPTEAKMEFSA